MQYTTLILALASSALAISGDIALDLFSQSECGGDTVGSITVRANSCFNASPVGWSSMKVTNQGEGSDAFPGTITAYSTNSCGCPTCGSHGYSASDPNCLTAFGDWGAANAVGWGVPPECTINSDGTISCTISKRHAKDFEA